MMPAANKLVYFMLLFPKNQCKNEKTERSDCQTKPQSDIGIIAGLRRVGILRLRCWNRLVREANTDFIFHGNYITVYRDLEVEITVILCETVRRLGLKQ